jgi:Ca-activated chloride channel family protein
MLGPIPSNRTLKILLEFAVKTASNLQQSNQQKNVILLEGQLTASLPDLPTPVQPLPLNLYRPISDEAVANPPPAEIMDALSRLTLYRLQEQARLEVNAGQYEKASGHLQKLATHLLAQGQRGLARTVLLEAEQIHQRKALSLQGDKEIKYGTRALLMAGEEKDQL